MSDRPPRPAFVCPSASGCVRARYRLGGECLAARLRDPHLCRLGDPASVSYKPAYESYLKGEPSAPIHVPTSPVEPPSILRRAANFAGAALRHVAAGRPKATDAEKAARLAICRGCDMAEDKPVVGLVCRARSCGCVLAIKTGWADQSCPLGKWGAIAKGRNGGAVEATPAADSAQSSLP